MIRAKENIIRKLLTTICQTTNDGYLLLIRVVVAVVMFAHGAQKMLGWFGGHGLEWTVEKWAQWFGFPSFVTILVALGEFFGPILLLAGFLTRIISVVTILIMAGAVYFVHYRWGFYMNWYADAERGEGFEYHILMVTLCAVLTWHGGGKASVDGKVVG